MTRFLVTVSEPVTSSKLVEALRPIFSVARAGHARLTALVPPQASALAGAQSQPVLGLKGRSAR